MKLQLLHPTTYKVHGYERIEGNEWRNRGVNESKDSYGNGIYSGAYIRRVSTGLFDKKGSEIYDEDIVDTDGQIGVVRFGRFQSSHEAGYSRFHRHQGFYIADKSGEQIRNNDDEDVDWKHVTVVGNVYENPDLLTKQDNND